MRLGGKVAIVTGAAAGIGRATALRFATEGASIVVADLRAPEAADVAAEILAEGGTAVSIGIDVSADADARAAVALAVDTYGRLDVVVNNAGIGATGSVVTLDEATWDRVWAVNVKGGFLLSKHAVPVLRRSGGGSILFTASDGGLQGTTGLLAYNASKAAVINMVRTMALDHARHGIRVNCVCPGPVDTAILDGMLGQSGLTREVMGAGVPWEARVGRPEEIAEAFLFLASADAGYITGVALPVDGGMIAGMFNPAAVED